MRARRQHDLLGDDAGTSLIELVVGMSLMSVFMAMFTGAVLMMNNAQNKAQAVTQSATQLNQAFLNLDRNVRYATSISTPGQGTSGDWYVELRATNDGSDRCQQYRVDIATQQLQQRAWATTASGATTPSAWAPTASGITNGNAGSGATTQPFYLRPVVGGARFQQLTINLVSPATAGSSTTSSMSTFTFAAVNSSVPAPTTAYCQDQGRP